jgi:hypothetical protein
MKITTRAPIEPPREFKQALLKAKKLDQRIVMDDVSIYPPSGRLPYWRLKFTFNGRSTDLSGGKSLDSAYAAFLKLIAIKESRHSASKKLPKFANSLLADVLVDYIDKGGREYRWKVRTKLDRRRDFNKLIETAANRKLKCGHITVEDVRDYINSAGTIQRGKTLLGITSTFLEWGLKTGYFTQEQANFTNQIQWTPPEDSNYVQAKSRRQQSQIKYVNEGSVGGEVLSPQQVIDFAQALQSFYKHGEGLVHTSANLGTRASETFMFTASQSVAEKNQGNYVDLVAGCVHVNYQVNDDPTKSFKTTKNGKFRKVVIPGVDLVVNGFDVFEWLSTRSAEALLEQASGKNPLALLFPNSTGGVLNLCSFNQRKVRPATATLGWRMDKYETAFGNERAMSRFTLHSLRAYFGTMAAEHWLYNENQLLEQGSWADIETLRRFYKGTTDDTYNSVLEIHQRRSTK